MTPLACHECPTPEQTDRDGWDCQDGVRTHCAHECMVACRDCWEWMHDDAPLAVAYARALHFDRPTSERAAELWAATEGAPLVRRSS